MKKPDRDSKRLALVTGSSGGIGTATVGLFLENGWDVVGVDLSAQRTVKYESITADLADAEEIRRVTQSIHAGHSRVDVIINNAAEQIVKKLLQTTPTEWDHTMAANVRPAYLLAVQLFELLRHAGGCVVNVASVHAAATSPGMAAYVASKGALVALTRAMALEFAPSGIRVNAVLPGAIETPMLAAGLKRSRSTVSALAARHPLGRVGRPRDVAEAIYFLADAGRSSFITGQTLTVDGGATARLSTE